VIDQPAVELAGGAVSTGATRQEGDCDGDGDVDLTDFGNLKNNLGIGWATWPEPHVPCP
jgi:hypothetical protein